MAYPTVSGPYGLKPIKLMGGRVYAGSTTKYPIASGTTTAIFSGDVVKLISAGTLERDAGTDAATPVGVLLGCSYTDSDLGFVNRQHYPGAITASDIMATVCDDPDVIMKVAVVSATTTIGYFNRTAVGNNAVIVSNTGDTTTGNSRIAVDNTTATTTTWPLRIIGLVDETTWAGEPGSYSEAIVIWNDGMHQFRNATGV